MTTIIRMPIIIPPETDIESQLDSTDLWMNEVEKLSHSGKFEEFCDRFLTVPKQGYKRHRYKERLTNCLMGLSIKQLNLLIQGMNARLSVINKSNKNHPAIQSLAERVQFLFEKVLKPSLMTKQISDKFQSNSDYLQLEATLNHLVDERIIFR